MVDGEVLVEVAVERANVVATLMRDPTMSVYQLYATLLGLPIHPVRRSHFAVHRDLGAIHVVPDLRVLLTRDDVREDSRAPGPHEQTGSGVVGDARGDLR